MSTMTTKLFAGVTAVLVLAVAVLFWQRNTARAAEGKAALEASNARARADSQVTLRIDAVRKVYGDSMLAVTRLVVQAQQNNDAIDRELKQNRVMLATLTAQVRVLNTTITSNGPTVEDSAGVRHDSVDEREPPFTTHADVELPRPPAKGTVKIRVALDPATIGLRLGCAQKADANGILAARATANAPPWLQLTIGRVEQEPDVCPSPVLHQGSAGPCKVPGSFGMIPCPSRTVVGVVGLVAGAVGYAALSPK
jgi:hypothetical protein